MNPPQIFHLCIEGFRAENRAKVYLVRYPPIPAHYSWGRREWGIQALVSPQIFPHVIKFLIVHEGTELFLVTYPAIYILIPEFVDVGWGLLKQGDGN